MGGRGNAGSRNTGEAVERPIRTDLTSRQLKAHVISELKAAGLSKVKTYSTEIRGYRAVGQSGYEWGEEYKGMFPPSIHFVGGLHTTAEKETAFLDKVEKALSKNFKIKRGNYAVEILGEYEKGRKR